MEIAKNHLIRTYGRKHGKKLSARQQWLVDNVLPDLFPFAGEGELRSDKVVEIKSATTNTSLLCNANHSPAKGNLLEIGFGNGEYLMTLAEKNPDKIIIGSEPFINGVASLLSKIIKSDKMTELRNYKIMDEYKNIRIWPNDIRKLLSLITCHLSQNINFFFEKIYILHPDPWPKARHEKRRLLSVDFLKILESFISKDGSIIIGTDHTDYYNWILEQIVQTNLKIKSRDIDIIKTKYQKKNIFGSDKTMYIVLGKN